MRIVVDDIAASKTGALSVLRDFYKAVTEYERTKAGSSDQWIFVLGDKLLEETDNIKVIVRDDVKASRKNRLMFDLKTGAGFFEGLRPDVLFSMQNTLPRGYRGRQVLYVHQPLPYQTWKSFSLFKPEEREYAVYQKLIGRMIDLSVKRADKVIVQTEWMRKAVIDKTGVAGDKVIGILPDIIIPDRQRDCDSVIYEKQDRNRFFYPAGEILYKNHACILEAVRLLINRGITDFEVAFTLNKGDIPSLGRYPEYEQVRYIGRIPRDEVFERYRREILLFPSYIETFGYPPAEARAVGGRVLASDCPFCHEVLKGYGQAAYFDPFKPEELAELMAKAIKKELFLETAADDRYVGSVPGSSWEKVIKVLTMQDSI